MANEFEMIAKKARDIMENPRLLYSYENIILGVPVKISNGSYKNMWAVSRTTWRGFKNINSPSKIYKQAMIKNKELIINSLRNAKSAEDINSIENKLYDIILEELKNSNKNPNSSIINSYNKVRKPIDLYIEHIVLMAKELDEQRKRLIPFLYLPLDSWIFNSQLLFSLEELGGVRLKRGSGYGKLTEESNYMKLQKILNDKISVISNQINMEFNKIFLDLIWNDRYKRNGANLFETNE